MVTIEKKIEKQNMWFDELIGVIRAHELQLETGVASQEVIDHYEIMMSGSDDETAAYGKFLSLKYFVPRILRKYINTISESASLTTLTNLAFSYSDSEILAWVEIPEEREDLERILILAEAKVNSLYHKHGYTLSSMIVEECDNLEIPEHYIPLISKNPPHK